MQFYLRPSSRAISFKAITLARSLGDQHYFFYLPGARVARCEDDGDALRRELDEVVVDRLDQLVLAADLPRNIVMAYVVMAYVVVAYTVTAFVVMVYVVVAYIVMAYTVMADMVV